MELRDNEAPFQFVSVTTTHIAAYRVSAFEGDLQGIQLGVVFQNDSGLWRFDCQCHDDGPDSSEWSHRMIAAHQLREHTLLNRMKQDIESTDFEMPSDDTLRSLMDDIIANNESALRELDLTSEARKSTEKALEAARKVRASLDEERLKEDVIPTPPMEWNIVVGGTNEPLKVIWHPNGIAFRSKRGGDIVGITVRQDSMGTRPRILVGVGKPGIVVETYTPLASLP